MPRPASIERPKTVMRGAKLVMTGGGDDLVDLG